MKTKAQSTIEYAVLIVVIVTAVVGMNLYVRRSVQANLKMTELRINALDWEFKDSKGRGGRGPTTGGIFGFPYGTHNFPDPFNTDTRFRIQLTIGTSFTVEVKDFRGRKIMETTIKNTNGTEKGFVFSGDPGWSVPQAIDLNKQFFDIELDARKLSSGKYNFEFSDGTKVEGTKLK